MMKFRNRINFITQYFKSAFCIALIFISVFCNYHMANAQVKFTASAPRSIPVNQNFKIKFALEYGLSNEFSFNSNNDFEIIGSPVIETKTQIINGVTTQYEAHTYLLHPFRQGVLIIPGAIITTNGIQLKSNNVEVLVSKPTIKKKKDSINAKRRKKQQKEIDNLFNLDVKKV